MRILFFIDSMTAGGKERRLSQLMKKLKDDTDFEFSLVIMNKDIHYKKILNLGIKIHYILRRTRRDLSVFNKFYKLCKKYKPDIVHCWDSMTAVYMIPACIILKIKIVNGMIIDSPVLRNILNRHWLRAKLTFLFSDVIVGNSNAGLKAYSAPDEKSVCIYNGVDLSRFDNLVDKNIIRKELFGEHQDSLFIIGMVAAFEERKDYKTLIRSALSIMSERDDVRFLLVGDGADIQTVKASVPCNLSSKIIFLGKRIDVESIINIFDIGILLTNTKVHGEGISNSILEYMALGKPVIATKGGGTNEIVYNGLNGYLIDHGDDHQLTEKINLLIGNKSLIDKLGSEGQKVIKEHFNIEFMTNNYKENYRKILSL